ncbi:MAG: isochorismate synthase [Solirubrobacteraceae bacterium]
MTVEVAFAAAGWLDADAAHRLQRRLNEGLVRARASGGTTIASVTAGSVRGHDPTGVVVASRRATEPWFVLEQPDPHRVAVAGLGSVHVLEARGPDRFTQVARRWSSLAATALADPPDGSPGSGLIAVGGFAFAPHGGSSRRWSGFAAASLIVPEISLARRDDRSWLTVNVAIAPDDTRDDLTVRVGQRLAGLRHGPLPLLDPVATGNYAVASSLPPSHYEDAVASAVQRIRGGELEKIVLAREVEVSAPVAHDPAAVLGVLRDAYASSFVFAVGRGEATFLGATPELLVRREGQRATTVALAGSSRRSADPSVDDHLAEALLRSGKDVAENAIVARRIARALRPHSVWVAAAPEPIVVRVANIQHLARPIRAQLASPLGAIELVAALHPTPAVGAEPGSALSLIPALEGLDRGWYAGPVGWTDASGDGEFCVAIRSALLRGRIARCYAGGGIVADSDPAAELAETELKLQVMLPVLAG